MAALLVKSLILFFAYAQVSSLTCHNALNVSTPSQMFETFSFSSEIDCSKDSSSRCLRLEGRYQVDSIEVDLTARICTNETICMQNCGEVASDLLREIVQQGVINTPLDLTSATMSPENCQRACCNTDNCNGESISSIGVEYEKTTYTPSGEGTVNMSKRFLILVTASTMISSKLLLH